MTKVIFFLHYIVNFLDDEHQIFHSLSDTRLQQLIKGENIHANINSSSNYLQFILSHNNCYIHYEKGRNKTHPRNKQWILPYLKMVSDPKYFEGFEKYSDYISDVCINDEIHKIFYVKEISVNIRKDDYNDIIKYCYDYEKHTLTRIVAIVHSGIFYFLDNTMEILSNILKYLIVQGKTIADVRKEFQECFLEAQNEENTHSDELLYNDWSKIYENIVIEHFGYYDKYLIHRHYYKIFKFERNLDNLFLLISDNLALALIDNNQNVIFKLKNNPESKFFMEIEKQFLENLFVFLLDDYYFIVEDIKKQTFIEIRNLVMLNMPKQIKVDITQYFMNLRNLMHRVLVNENRILNKFIESLLKLTNSPLCLIIQDYLFEFHRMHENYFITDQTKKRKQKIDMVLFVSKYIIVSKLCLKLFPLSQICNFIIKNFDFQGENINHITYFVEKSNFLKLFWRRKIDKSINETENFHHEYKFRRVSKKTNQYLPINSDTIVHQTQIYGIEYEKIRLNNQKCFFGVYDGDFSMFVIYKDKKEKAEAQLSEFYFGENENQTKAFSNEESNVIEKFNDNKHGYCCNKIILDMVAVENIFAEIPVFIDIQDYHIDDKQNNLLLQNLIIQKHLNVYLLVQIPTKKNYYASFFVIDSSFANLKYNRNKLCIDNVFLPKIEWRELKKISFFVEKSSFELIFLRFIKLKSNTQLKSSCTAFYMQNGIYLDVHDCNCQLFCEIPNKIEIFSSSFCTFLTSLKFSRNEMNDSYFSVHLIKCEFKSICIENFVKVKAKNNFISSFTMNKDIDMFYLKCKRCEVYLIDDIPKNLTTVDFECSEIFFINPNFNKTENHQEENSATVYEIKTSQFSTFQKGDQIMKQGLHLYLKTITIKNDIEISGSYECIFIENCEFNFLINADVEKIYIIDHTGTYTIKNLIERVRPHKKTNRFSLGQNNFILNELCIHQLYAFKIEYLQISNSNIRNAIDFETKKINVTNVECAFRLKIDDDCIIIPELSNEYEKTSENYMIIQKI